MLSDADAIRNLLGRWTERIDAGDWDGIGELFAEGRLATEDGQVLAAGAAEVAAFHANGTKLHDGSPRTKHLVVDTVLTFAEWGDAAEARSSYVVLQAVLGELALQPIIAGRYVDTFVRSPAPEGWSWRERRFAVDLIGDLSHHLGSRF